MKSPIHALRCAYRWAAQSPDPSTKVGAVLIDPTDDRIVATAINTFTCPLHFLDEKNTESPLKYQLIEHAERAVIYSAARSGICTSGLCLVATWACCPDCARAIVSAGIVEVYTHRQALERTPKRWREEIKLGIKILTDAGVDYTMIDAKIGDVKGLLNGEVWYP